jgi:hypothetical protein
MPVVSQHPPQVAALHLLGVTGVHAATRKKADRAARERRFVFLFIGVSSTPGCPEVCNPD